MKIRNKIFAAIVVLVFGIYLGIAMLLVGIDVDSAMMAISGILLLFVTAVVAYCCVTGNDRYW